MKQNKGLNGDLKPEYKTTTIMAMMGPSTDTDIRSQPFKTD